MNTHPTFVMNAYRQAAVLMADARALHRRTGNSDEALAAYHAAALATAAAGNLDRLETTK